MGVCCNADSKGIKDPRIAVQPGCDFKLEYFPVHGRGSFIKMYLKYCNMSKYQNVEVGFQEFGPKKMEGYYGMWGVMPMLTLPNG